MNNKILFTIITIVLLGIGGYYFVNQKGNNTSGKDTNGTLVVQSHRSYEIEVISNTSDIQPKQKATIQYKIKNDKGEIVKDYATVHEKIMHFITVRKDLTYFQHLHPVFNEATGEFTVDVTFPQDGPYRIFPDFTPGEENLQKLPVTVYHDIDVGNASNYYKQSVVPDAQAKKQYGDYEVATTFPQSPTKQSEITYSFDISKSGKSVTDLENYLGALGHSVILKAGTLDFIHTHALEAKDGSSGQGHGTQPQHGATQSNTTAKGSKIEFATTFPESGIYKIFTQFQHEGKVITIDYTFAVN